MEGHVHVRIENFESYLGRKDIAKPTWFSFPIDFFTSPRFLFNLTPEAITAFAYLVGQAVGEKRAQVEVNQPHLLAATGLTPEKFTAGVAILERFQLVHVIRTEHVRDPNATVRDPCTTDRQTGQDTQAPERTYVPCTPDGELFEKKERRAPARAPDEFLPAFEPVKEILAGRGISKALQESWLQLYTAEFMVEKIKALKVWELTAGAKGKKKNWGAFYSGRFRADWDAYSRKLPGVAPRGGQGPEKRPNTWFKTQVEGGGQ